jgi:bacterioferritin (cytochrome b1)
MSEWKPMERTLHKELWKIRFEKMLTLEKEAAHDYQTLIKECDENEQQSHPVKGQLEAILKDEGKHIRLCEELLKILERQKTE